MNMFYRHCSIFLCVLIVLSCMICATITAYAHDALLDVVYDKCIYSSPENGAELPADGIDETWYILIGGGDSSHMATEINTIEYYFAPESEDGQYTWTSGNISPDTANEIKETYAQSMKKWNNVYFYSYEEDGSITKNKIINIVEGTEEHHNLIIYPALDLGSVAGTYKVGPMQRVETVNLYHHNHYSEWKMHVNLVHFYEHGSFYTSDYVNAAREKAGAHEVGHVLGLYDIEGRCGAEGAEHYHHQELLMGYGATFETCEQNITYKDIAGVAIIRGFHNDNDHKWLLNGTQNGKYKLICSICNGVRWTDTLAGYVYSTYNQCNQQHELSSNNMMAVASYGDRDYYKCKYCRYVAPFDEIVPQNYTVTSVNSTYHKYTNIVPGLGYTFLEEHDMTIHGCLTCGYAETSHTFGRYLYLNGNEHRRACTCGKTETQAHSVLYDEIENGRYANCLGCKVRLDLTKDNANIAYGITNMRTANGSYILPNGIIVLVQADLEAYENGTLQFYNVGDQTQTE